jgi:hypothetical protein
MKGAITIAALALLVGSTLDVAAQNSFSRDGTSCDLNSRQRLSDVCPNGFGMPSGGSQADLLARFPNIAGMIVQAANEYGVDPRVALAVAGHESRMSACAGSPTGVQGPMQLTITTGRGFDMDRGILSENIRGGMLTLRDAIRRCGGTGNIRCLADRYNGSNEGERVSWTDGVTNRLSQMNSQNLQMPAACNQQQPELCDAGPGDFPTTPVAASPPPPSSTDVLVGANEV